MSSTIQMPTQKQIDQWKKEHGSIHKLIVGDTFCIVRMPTLIDIDMSASLGGADPIETGRVQLENCWLYGDDRIKSNLGMLRDASKKMGTVFPVYKTEVKDVDCTEELILDLREKSVPEELIKKVQSAGYAREAIVYKPTGNDSMNTFSALFIEPDQTIFDKAQTSGSGLAMGLVYLQECFLLGSDYVLNKEDEPVHFAFLMAGHQLLKRYTTSVEKL